MPSISWNCEIWSLINIIQYLTYSFIKNLWKFYKLYINLCTLTQARIYLIIIMLWMKKSWTKKEKGHWAKRTLGSLRSSPSLTMCSANPLHRYSLNWGKTRTPMKMPATPRINLQPYFRVFLSFLSMSRRKKDSKGKK